MTVEALLGKTVDLLHEHGFHYCYSAVSIRAAISDAKRLERPLGKKQAVLRALLKQMRQPR